MNSNINNLKSIAKMNKSTKDYILRKNLLRYVKMKYIQLIISYLQTGNKENVIEKLNNTYCSTLELFIEILYNFKELLLNLKRKDETLYNDLMQINDLDDFLDKLIYYYSFFNEFRNIIELPLCLKLYILIKTYEDLYSQNALKEHFEKLFLDEELNNVKDDDNLINLDDEETLLLSSKFSKNIYKFLEKIIVKIEIKVNEEEEDIVSEMTEKISENIIKENDKNNNRNKRHNTKKITNKNNLNTSNNNSEDDDSESEDESENDFKNKKNQILFFVRPYLSFSLSEYSKNIFFENVNRENATSKFVELISFADYCLFEMIVNLHTIGKNKFKKWMADIDYKYIEIINYIIIMINNILIIKHYYSSPDLPPEDYDVVDSSKFHYLFLDNIIITIIQTILLIFSLVLWFYFKFANLYQLNLMNVYNRNFIFRRKGEKSKISPRIVEIFAESEEVSTLSVLNDINNDIKITQWLYVSIIETLLTNREINMLIFTVIFNLCYFITLRHYV